VLNHWKDIAASLMMQQDHHKHS